MKSISTQILKAICALVIILTTSTTVSAQCTSPSMVWANPVLVSGTAGQTNAKYKFPSVTPGVDAYMTIKSISGGATLTSIDDNTYGYSAAWQPVVKTPTNAGAGDSYVAFSVQFTNSNNLSNHVYNCFQLSFIDVDGDNDKVREFIETKGEESYAVSNTTFLTMSQQNGFTKAMGSLFQYSGIDTSAYNTNINFKFINTDKVQEVRIGNNVSNGYTVQDRYTCGYFKPLTMVAAVTLPVKYASFDGVATDKSVILNWATEIEVNNSHFEVERSFDGTSFKTIGLVLDGFDIAGGTGKKYQFKDNSAELAGKSVAYYRLNQIDMDGKSTYSTVLAIRLQSKAGVTMEISPNPFAQDLYVRFNSSEIGTAEIRIINVSGQTLLSKQVSISKGYNNMHVEGLSRLATGMYVAQLVMNGNVIDKQKIVKD